VAQGTGKRYNAGKGYGFIAYDGGTPDVFLHKPAIEADGYRNLQDCQRVAYTITRLQGPAGRAWVTFCRIKPGTIPASPRPAAAGS
jgi:cold shock protein